MTNFDINLESVVPSSLTIKASGSLDTEIKKDLELPDGEDIKILLENEEKFKKSSKESF